MKRNTNMKQTIITIILALVTLTTTAQVNLETNNTPDGFGKSVETD